MSRTFLAALGLTLIAFGCGPNPPDAAPPAKITGDTQTKPPDETSQPSTDGKSDQSQANHPNSGSDVQHPASSSKNEKAAPTLPDDLKNGAYEYYGLGNDKPIDYELVGDAGQGIRTGSQTTTLKAVKDGKAVFEQTRTGGLDQLGNDELQLSSDGIHVIHSSIVHVDPKNLEFPPDPKPGFTWTSHDKIDNPGEHFDVVSKLIVKGFEDVDTKAGVKHALLVTSTGRGTQNGIPVRIDTQAYYVKGFGVVKEIIETTENGKHSKITQQITD